MYHGTPRELHKRSTYLCMDFGTKFFNEKLFIFRILEEPLPAVVEAQELKNDALYQVALYTQCAKGLGYHPWMPKWIYLR